MKKSNNNNWVYTITISAFFITLLFSIFSDIILSGLGMIFGIIIILLFISLGVVFDMIGVAVATSSDSPFHAMASKKVSAAKVAIRMINNSARVSSFCNDVIGDICNIMSGSAGLIVATSLAEKYNFNTSITVLLVTSIIASLTIGGKAFGKNYGMKNNEKIVHKVARTLSMLKK